MGKVSEDVVNPSVGADPPRSRGGSDPSPGGCLSTSPAHRVGHRHQFFQRGHRGLMCGVGVARPWCRGGSGGGRDSQLFLGDVITGMFSKIYLDIIIITNTTTEEHDITRIVLTLPSVLHKLAVYLFVYSHISQQDSSAARQQRTWKCTATGPSLQMQLLNS